MPEMESIPQPLEMTLLDKAVCALNLGDLYF
jgi:hypothetical protein